MIGKIETSDSYREIKAFKNFPRPLLQSIKDKMYDFWTIPTGFTQEFQGKDFGARENSNDIKNFAFSFNHCVSTQTLLGILQCIL